MPNRDKPARHSPAGTSAKAAKTAKTPQKRRRAAPATLRSTSGAGFHFEDLISAWLMVHMIQGAPIPFVGGTASQVQAQVSALGWTIDDLLVTSDAGRLALSAKGNTQVTAAGLPRDFVERAWAQWRDTTSVIDRTKDRLALVTNAPIAAFEGPWREIRAACESPDPTLGLARIRQNRKQLRVFQSVLAVQPTPRDEDAVELIRHLHVLPLNLEAEHSTDRSAALGQIRVMLASADAAEAEEVWEYLVKVAKRVRLSLGTLTLQDLWEELKHRFRFLNRPSFLADWRYLDQITSDNKSRIETQFSSGHVLPRTTASDGLLAAITSNRVVEIIGESGTGKSALLKRVAESHLTDWAQVWLRPEDLSNVLSANGRTRSGLRHPIEEILPTTAAERGLLVLDSAERISQEDSFLARKLIQFLRSSTSGNTGWHAVIVTQRVDPRLTGPAFEVAVGALSAGEVQDAIRGDNRLAWLASRLEAVANLGNLKTLAWVLESSISLPESGVPVHYPLIADQLWSYWTGDRRDVQVLTMELACKEAEFHPRTPLTELGVERARVLDPRTSPLPLRIDKANRVEFEHDLAADLARFEWLKQFTEEPERWVALATNPLWRNAFRVFGQYLLRESVGERAAWDTALESADTAEGGRSSAGNLLLEALMLDPEADRFLYERTPQLLADKGALLTRALSRFRHISTSQTIGSEASIVEVLLASRFRSVIIEQWFPVLRYLVGLREQLQGMELPALAEVIESWLSQMPPSLGEGTRVPYRRELAQIALDMARTVQAEKATGTWYIEKTTAIYTAALAGISDLPDKIGAWALELASRRAIDAHVQQQVSAIQHAKAAEHAKRMAENEAYRSRYDAAQRMPPTLRSFRTPLPAWPLGPRGEVDPTFRKAVLEKGLSYVAFHDASLAKEILLAVLIEESPTRDDQDARYETNLGLTSRESPNPSTFNQSPLMAFLGIAPDAALEAMTQLVNFCTDRWAEQDGDDAPVQLAARGKSLRPFIGNCAVLQWSQQSSHRNGHLFAALDALERWLTMQIDKGVDVAPVVARLFRETRSVGMLGVLVNIAKYLPDLLKGPLLPLLSSPRLYYWDALRVEQIGNTFQPHMWIRFGEGIYEFMRKWAFAPHRSRSLLDVVTKLLLSDTAFASDVREMAAQWKQPRGEKARLEHDILLAQLDSRNSLPDSSGEGGVRFTMPPDLEARIDTWHAENGQVTEALVLPRRCIDRLSVMQALGDEEARYLASCLTKFDAVEGQDDKTKASARVAAAATLMARGHEWLEAHAKIRGLAEGLIEQTVSSLEVDQDGGRAFRIGYSTFDLRLLAIAVVDQWSTSAGTPRWERLLLRLMTSQDRGGAAAVVAAAQAARLSLGAAWWRLLKICSMWAALALLTPHYGDPPSTPARWQRWRERLTRLRVWGVASSMQDLRLDRLALGVHRIDFSRQVRNAARSEDRIRRSPEFGRGPGLHTLVLQGAFRWLLDGEGTGNWEHDVALCTALWKLEVDGAPPKRDGDSELDLPGDQFGYEVVATLARKLVDAPPGLARLAWFPIIELGPDGEAAVRHFLSAMFLQLQQTSAKPNFEEEWAHLVEFMLSPRWSANTRIYRTRRLVGQALGFGHESALARLPIGAVGRHADLYRRWASTYLHRDEDALSSLSAFASTDVGAPIRRDALVWIAAALPESAFRFDEVEGSLLELCHKALNDHRAELRKDGELRGSVVNTLDWLARHNSAPALVLQQQVRLINAHAK